MRLSQINKDMLTRTVCDKILFEGFADSGEKADIIMTLGSRKACEYRVPKAAELYHSGRAKRLVFCGGRSQQTAYGYMPEFEAMLFAADEFRIPRSRILTEENSMNTAENIMLGCKVISEKMPQARKIILVTAAYHMKRAFLLAQRLAPQFEFIPCAADSKGTRRETWFLTEKGIRTVCDEIMKLKAYAENGSIEDIDERI